MRRSFGFSILAAIGLALGLPSFATAQDAQQFLAGIWSLNPEQSDDTDNLEREALESLPKPPGRRVGIFVRRRPAELAIAVPGGFGLPRGFDPELVRRAVDEASNAAERMVLTFKGDTLLLGLDRDVPYVIVANGKNAKRPWVDGSDVEIEASWKDRKLRIERKHENELEITRTFALDRDSGRLIVRTEVDGPIPSEIEVEHVYDPVPEPSP